MRIALVACLFLASVCSAQVAPISKLQTAGGFLEVCGRADTQLSKEQVETMKRNAQAGQPMDALKQALNDSLTEQAMCLAYVDGLIEGWKEGHEHGVTAAQFPDGWPEDEEKAIKALPLKQLQASNAAMKIDVPCIPDYVTIGQERDIIVKYVRESKNPFISVAMTHRVMWLAFQQAFPCKMQPKW
jgi:hypothetical protein